MRSVGMPNRRSHHLTGDLRASRQSPQQRDTGTGAGTGASDSLVRLGLVDGTSRSMDMPLEHLSAPFRPDCDFRALGHCGIALSVLLKRSNIHGNLVPLS